MTSESRHRRLESLFHECVELPDDQRAVFLEAHCAGDPDLRAELEDLLRHDETNAPGELGLPLTIGAYILDQKIGEGGFGDVFAAEQTAPVRRRVAFKILKAGMDSRAVLARFEAERQALALMDHPGIAKVFDAGVTESGRPYFVMELVAGEPITAYCDRHSIPLAARLRLFVSVCRAMEHAHTKGIIHRDLKPSNILVTTVDAVPHPKVIDFGIAKATTAALAEAPVRTMQGEILGTPEYMSPEQAASNGSDVDTRSDVYSLGVVLYRLLAGCVPFATERLRGGTLAAMRRILLEEEPAKPSEAALTTTTPNTISARTLRGDLDWIVLRALEKDRERRYSSSAAFAEDVERHLRSEPILARSPTTRYRLGRMMRRHRALVAGAGAVVVALIVGLAATTTQAIRATRAEELARREAEVATAVNEFLARMLSAGNPILEAKGLDVTMRYVVERAAAEVDGDPPASPEVEAGVRHALGATALALGLYERAEAQLARADAIRRVATPHSLPALETRMKLAELSSLTGRDARSESTLVEIAADVERVSAGDESLRAYYFSMRGSALANLSRFAEADSFFTRAVQIRREAATPGREDARAVAALGSALQELAQVKKQQGRFEEAESMAREGLDVAREAFPGDHFDVASAEMRLASVLKDLGKYPEAEARNREAIDRGERVLGADHPLVAEWRSNLAQILTLQGRLDPAETE